MPKEIQSIYDYFKKLGYNREAVDEMLIELTDEEFAIVRIRNGKDLDNPVATKEYNEEIRSKYYGSIVPKMKRLLANPSGKRKRKSKSKTINKDIETNKEKVKSTKIIEIPQREINKTRELEMSKNNKIVPNKNTKENENINKKENIIENININENIISKENYLKMLELLRAPSFTQMMNILSVKEAIIIALKLGYLDGKYYSTETISKFLEIEEQEIRETAKKILLLYKENINQLIDETVQVVTEEKIVLSLEKTIKRISKNFFFSFF